MPMLGRIRKVLWIALVMLPSCSNGPAVTPKSTDMPASAPAPNPDQSSTLPIKYEASINAEGSTLFGSGTSSFPTGTELRFEFFRQREQFFGTVVKYGKDRVGFTLISRTSEFHHEVHAKGPGVYVLVVSLWEARQDKDLLPKIIQIAGKTREWRFVFRLWKDSFVGDLPSAWDRVSRHSQEVQELIGKLDKAGESETTWTAQKEELFRACDTLAQTLVESKDLQVFPASLKTLYQRLRLVADLPRSASINPDKVVERVRQPMDESLPGTEFSLWLIQDLRRSVGRKSDLWRATLESRKGYPGVKEWESGLADATVQTLDALESKIRSQTSR